MASRRHLFISVITVLMASSGYAKHKKVKYTTTTYGNMVTSIQAIESTLSPSETLVPFPTATRPLKLTATQQVASTAAVVPTSMFRGTPTATPLIEPAALDNTVVFVKISLIVICNVVLLMVFFGVLAALIVITAGKYRREKKTRQGKAVRDLLGMLYQHGDYEAMPADSHTAAETGIHIEAEVDLHMSTHLQLDANMAEVGTTETERELINPLYTDTLSVKISKSETERELINPMYGDGQEYTAQLTTSTDTVEREVINPIYGDSKELSLPSHHVPARTSNRAGMIHQHSCPEQTSKPALEVPTVPRRHSSYANCKNRAISSPLCHSLGDLHRAVNVHCKTNGDTNKTTTLPRNFLRTKPARSEESRNVPKKPVPLPRSKDKPSAHLGNEDGHYSRLSHFHAPNTES